MTETPNLQPKTNGKGASEFAMTRWGLIGFVGLVALEMVVNAAMTHLTGQPYDAIGDTMFFTIGGALVGGPLGYTTARTVKKGTLAKVAAGVDPTVLNNLAEKLAGKLMEVAKK